MAAIVDGSRQIPATISIDHQLDMRPNRPAHCIQPLQIVVGVRAAYLDLDTLEAAFFNRTARIIDQLIERPVEPAAIRIVGHYSLLLAAAEQLPQRHAGSFGLDVP